MAGGGAGSAGRRPTALGPEGGGGWREPAPGKEEWQPVGHCILTAGLLTIRERATKFKPEFRAKINKYDIKKMI